MVEINPECVNTAPEIMPWLFYTIMEQWRCYPLSFACEDAGDTGELEIVEILLSAGADVNGKIADGHPSTQIQHVYYQKRKYWYEVSSFLIEHGAAIGNPKTLESILFKPNDYEIEDEMIVNSVFINTIAECDCEEINWDDLLCNCAYYDRYELMLYLLENYNADINADINASVHDKTILCGIVSSVSEQKSDSFKERRYNMTKYLLEHGADPTLKSTEGKDAMDYAIESKNEKMIELIAAYYN